MLTIEFFSLFFASKNRITSSQCPDTGIQETVSVQGSGLRNNR
ncbi:MAG: hypothetical protein ACRC6C_05675 [Wolbachia pipientis]